MRGIAMRRRTVAALAFLLVGLLAASIPAAADPHDRLDRIQRRKQRAHALKERYAARSKVVLDRIQKLDKKRATVESKVDELSDELDALDAQISIVVDRLTKAQQKVAVLSDELQQVLTRLDGRTETFEDRAVAAYKAGPSALLDTMLSSETFTELVDRYAYYEAALDADAKIVEEIQVLRDDTEIQRAQILEKQHEIATSKRKLEQDRVQLAAVKARHQEVLTRREQLLGQKKKILAKVESKKARYRAIEDQLDRESDRVEALLARRAARAAGATSGVSTSGSGQLLWPAAGPVTSGFGYRTHPIFGDTRLHTGIDIGAPYGAPVVAADDGVVSYAGVMSGYGNVIVISHSSSLATTYNHLSAFAIGSGQRVARGERIGSVGCSGYCTGPHLHFEVRVNGSPVDPMPYLR